MMVAEKPSIAESISKALGGDPVQNPGIHKPCKIWTFDGFFKGFPAQFKVTSVAGHMYSRDFDKSISKAKNMDPETLFDAETQPQAQSGAMVYHIQTVSKGCDILCLWLDCDKEGENICFEVIENCRQNLPSPCEDYIFRAKFSSIAHQDIHIAYENLMHKPNRYESLSVDARQVLDLKIGVAFSRLLSQEIFKIYPEIRTLSYTGSVTYGPC